MAVALKKHVLVIQYKLGKFDPASKIMPGQDGLKCSVENIHGDVGTGRTQLPVIGCVDYEVFNAGTAIAYLFDGAVKILPGQGWAPQKSSPLPLIDQPTLTFQGDYQQSRNVADLGSPVIQA